jgi:hypothetical protein
MRNLSDPAPAAPAWPQSSASTSKFWVEVPDGRLTLAEPVNRAWVLGPQAPSPITSRLNDNALMRTPSVFYTTLVTLAIIALYQITAENDDNFDD